MAKPSGEIYLLKNVVLQPSYNHTIDFVDRKEQLTYFKSFIKHTLLDYSYIRKEREYIRVDLSMEELDDVNYMFFRSETDGRLYYAFVTNKVYSAPAVTYVYFQIDVMQTYQFDYTWRPSFIKQAHVDRWNAQHKPIYSKTEEGLDYGEEYSVETGFRIQQSAKIKWLVASVLSGYKALDGEGFNGSGARFTPNQSIYNLFMIPVHLKALTENRDGQDFSVAQRLKVQWHDSTSGEVKEMYVCEYEHFINFMNNSSIGDYIKSITLLEYNPFIESETERGSTLIAKFRSDCTVEARFFNIAGDLEGSNLPVLILRDSNPEITKPGHVLASTDWDDGISGSLPTKAQWDEIKDFPYTTKRDKRFESKLLCAPYRYNILTDWRNGPIVFKNEYMTTDKIDVCFSYGLSYNLPFRYWIKNYKNDPEGRYTTLSQPIGLEFPVLSDAYYQYMLQNKNTIKANNTTAIVNASTGVVQGAVGGASAGWVGAAIGAATGTVNGVINYTNYIRGEVAKQKDLKSHPDTILTSDDSSFNLNDKNYDICFYRMKICCENEEIIASIFNMSGYKVNRVDIPNTRSRVRFNYIQTIGANLHGSINQYDLNLIKEIYDNGITIWHYNPVIFHYLDYSYENIEVNLL